MPKPRPEPRLASDELRHMMFLTWGELVRSGALADIDRAAHLHGIVNDPYADLAFRDLSREDKMLICAHRLMENGEWLHAYRILARLDRIDSQRQRPAPVRPKPPEPEPELEPELQPQPKPAPAQPRAFVLGGRRWSAAQIDALVQRHPGLADMSAEDTLRILAADAPAPDT